MISSGCVTASAQEFRAAQDKRTLAEHAIARARAAILEITASLKLIDPPRALLDAALQIEALQERLGAFEKASVDRANIENLQQTNEYAARRLLRELGRPTDLDQAESLRLRADEPAIIRGWARSSPSFEARPTRRGGRSLVMTNRSGRGRPSSASWNNRLTWMRSAAQCGKPAKRGISNAQLAQAHDQLVRAQKDAAAALAQHKGWYGTAEELRQLAVPMDATLDQFETRFLDLSRRRQTLSERVSSEKESIRERESSLHSVALQQDLPSEEAVLAAQPAER